MMSRVRATCLRRSLVSFLVTHMQGPGAARPGRGVPQLLYARDQVWVGPKATLLTVWGPGGPGSPKLWKPGPWVGVFGRTHEKSGGRNAWFSPRPGPSVARGQLAPSLTQVRTRNLPRVPGQQPVSPGVPSEPSAQWLRPSEAQGESLRCPRRPSPESGPQLWPVAGEAGGRSGMCAGCSQGLCHPM